MKSNWLRKLFPGRPTRPVVAHKRNQFRPSLEGIEARVVPAVTSVFNAGTLTITVDNDTDITVTDVATNVKINGNNPTVGGVDTVTSASTVTSIEITASGTVDPNVYDLSGLTKTAFNNLTSISVTDNGTSGNDTLKAPVFSDTWSFTAQNVGDGSGNGVALSFSGIENLTLSGGDDSVTLGNGGVSGVLNGGGGSNSLTGPNSATNWFITGPDSGTTTALSGSFQNFKNLTGGDADDVFTLSTGTLSGSLQGGPSAGTDTLNINAAGAASVGLAGTYAGITGGFTGIETVNASNGGTATNDGVAAVSWAVSGTSATVGSLTLNGFTTLQASGFGDTFNVNADSTVNLAGGAGNDTFSFKVNAGVGVYLNGSISGGSQSLGGADTLDFTAFGATDSVFANLSASTTDGFSGDATDFLSTNILSGFTGIDTINVADAAIAKLTGRNVISTFTVDADPTYYDGVATLNFSGFTSANDLLVGGGDVDTFDVSADVAGELDGSAGDDIFNVTAGAFSGAILGGLGSDTFNVSGGTFSGSIDGDERFGTSGVADTFSQTGGTFTGTINGEYGSDSFTVSGGTFSGLLHGNEDADSLTVSGGTFDGTAFGDLASDTFLVSGGTFNGTINGDTGVAGVGVTDTLTFTGGTIGVNAAYNGDAGTDLLINSTGATGTFVVNTANTGTFTYTGQTNTLAFSSVENLTGDNTAGDTFTVKAAINVLDGRGGNDTFDLQTNGSAASVVGGAGSDTLTYSTRSSAVTTTLSVASTGNGYTGVSTNVAAFTGIDVVTGGSGSDKLYGRQATSTWTFAAGGNTYNDGTNGQDLAFSSFENLYGGTAVDTFKFTTSGAFAGSIDGGVGSDVLDFSGATAGKTINVSGANTGSVSGTNFASVENLTGSGSADSFVFANGASVSGKIDGGGAADTLSYAAYTTAVRANLTSGAATNVFGGANTGVSNVENLTGGSGNDILVGNAADNILLGGAGNDIMIGGDGNDTLTDTLGYNIFVGGDGVDTITGGSGNDIAIAGGTTYDANALASNNYTPFTSILAEWSRTTVSVATRKARVTGAATGGLNGSYNFGAANLSADDGDADVLNGLAGTNNLVINN